MRSVTYLLVGGGLASVRAAQQIRCLDPDNSILLVSEESQLPYDRPPLSKEYLAGEKKAEDIVLESAESLADQRIEIALSRSVTDLDVTSKIATLSSGDRIAFEKALIATGGRPVRLATPGSELKGVHYLRTAIDADALRSKALPGRKVVVIGGGFIGLEVASTLHRRGLDVTVVESLPTIWAKFRSETLSSFIMDHCTRLGIKFLTGAKVTEFIGETDVRGVVIDTGELIECDLACVGIGIRPNVDLATKAGIAVNDGVMVNEHMRTSQPDIFAAGDVINYYDPTFARRCRAEHWGHAEHSGQVAGRNMAGACEKYDLLPYIWSDLFDLHLEFAGDESDHDRQVIRGNPPDGSFMILYLRNDFVTAYLSVNVPAKEYSIVRRMIQRKANISGRESELADTNTSLRSLL